MSVRHSQFASNIEAETAFTVLDVAKRLAAAGKRVYELEIGDSPFDSPQQAVQQAAAALERGDTHYCSSAGLPDFRQAVAERMGRDFDLQVSSEQVVVAPGAKPFQQLFCEAFLDPGDGVLVFSPHFPTYLPNIARRGARAWLAPLDQRNDFRPRAAQVEQFLQSDPHPRAIFLNSPHNPTGGVATREDLAEIAELIRGRDVAVFSDEPYEHMAWRGRHHSLLEEPGMLEQCVAAYTFSKSYSMSGWRLGYAVTASANAALLADLVNTTLSCVPPHVQRAGIAAIAHGAAMRDEAMAKFRAKVEILVRGLRGMDDVTCTDPAGTFYVFPGVAPICNRSQITSHGLAMYLLEGADEEVGVACLGGECFGVAGAGFLRFSCAESDERLREAVEFIGPALANTARIEQFVADRPEFRLAEPLTI